MDINAILKESLSFSIEIVKSSTMTFLLVDKDIRFVYDVWPRRQLKCD